MPRTLYDILGVDKDADADTITSAFRKLAWEYHPDRNPGDRDAEALFKEVSEAYAILSDPEKKRQYDRTGNTNFCGRDEVRDIILGEFGSLLQSIFQSGQDPTTVDIMTLLKKRIRNKISTEDKNLQECRRSLGVMKKMVGRFYTTEEYNFLDGMVVSEVRDLESAEKEVLDRLKTFNRAKDRLDKYGYQFTSAKDMGAWSSGAWTATLSVQGLPVDIKSIEWPKKGSS